MIPGKSTLVLTSSDTKLLKYVCAILNSKLIINYIKERYSSSSYNGGVVFTKEMINNIPLTNDISKKTIFVNLVDQILHAKLQDPIADTSDLEDEIDQLVYGLYDLTPDEITLVEGG